MYEAPSLFCIRMLTLKQQWHFSVLVEENKSYSTLSKYTYYLANIYQKLYIPVVLFLHTSSHRANMEHSDFHIKKCLKFITPILPAYASLIIIPPVGEKIPNTSSVSSFKIGRKQHITLFFSLPQFFLNFF